MWAFSKGASMTRSRKGFSDLIGFRETEGRACASLLAMQVSRRKKMKTPEQGTSRPLTEPVMAKKCRDIWGILLLIGLYILQGIPLGLAAVVPYLLQSDKHTANYQLQAIFSWVFWPFSLKLLWAPLVDSIYWRRLGRRKSWLLPVQYALGIDLCILGGRVDAWLGREPGHTWGPLGVASPVQIYPLTAAFFGLTLLAATQDIVVDGWALTMLSEDNVGWASTCNTVGQSIGYILGFIVFIALESPEFVNSYLRSAPLPGQGLISFSGFLYFCGAVFLISTTLVGIFKREVDERALSHSSSSSSSINGLHDEAANPLLASGSNDTISTLAVVEANATQQHMGLMQTYRVMLGVLRLRPVLRYIAFIFIIKFVFSAGDSIFGLKMMEHGLSKERLALIGASMMPLEALLPVLITRWSNGPRPLGAFLNACIPRVLVTVCGVLLVYFVDYFKVTPPLTNGSTGETGEGVGFSTLFYVLLVSQLCVYAVFSNAMFVCQMAFHARISDPAIGGTYMTLLNTFANLATALPATLMLFLVEPLTRRSCDAPSLSKALSLATNTSVALDDASRGVAERFLAANATCRPPHGAEVCQAVGGTCRIVVDGFYIEAIVCLGVGVVAYFTLLRGMARSLDRLPLSAYRWRKRVGAEASGA